MTSRRWLALVGLLLMAAVCSGGIPRRPLESTQPTVQAVLDAAPIAVASRADSAPESRAASEPLTLVGPTWWDELSVAGPAALLSWVSVERRPAARRQTVPRQRAPPV